MLLYTNSEPNELDDYISTELTEIFPKIISCLEAENSIISGNDKLKDVPKIYKQLSNLFVKMILFIKMKKPSQI